ncbi:MAG: hypothetical protein Q4B99_04860 [Clostridia bacterium]|nr:hypothetical protein [Clostridia bacterium]
MPPTSAPDDDVSFTATVIDDIDNVGTGTYTTLASVPTGMGTNELFIPPKGPAYVNQLLYVSPDESEIITQNTEQRKYMIFKDGALDRVVEYDDDNWREIADEVLDGKQVYEDNLSYSFVKDSPAGRNLIILDKWDEYSIADGNVFKEYTVSDAVGGRTWLLKDLALSCELRYTSVIRPLFADAGGNLYLRTTNPDLIVKFDPNGEILAFTSLLNVETEFGRCDLDWADYMVCNPEAQAIYLLAATAEHMHVLKLQL